MKVLLVNDYAAPRGGAEILTLALRDGLRARGHEVRLFTSTAGDGAPQADDRCFGTTSRWRTLLQSWNPWAGRALRRTLADFQPDVVHVRMFLTQLSPSILAPLRSVPSLAHVVWYRPVCPTGTKLLPSGAPCTERAGSVCRRAGCIPLRDYPPLMFQRRRTLRDWRSAFDRTIVNSDAVGDALRADDLPVDAVVPNGVAIHDERTEMAPVPTVTFAGRMVREKGVDVLLDAFSQVLIRHPEARLHLAGEGPERSALQARARGLGLDGAVSWPGRLPHEHLMPLRARAWVDVTPSRWAEPFGITVPEAMMLGVATIASDLGGLRDTLVDGETGLAVPAGDVKALAAALDRILGDRDLALRMGHAGRERALAEFSASIFCDRIEATYRDLISASQRA